MPFRLPPLTPTVKKMLIFLASSFVIVAVLQNLAGIGVFGWLALDVSHGAVADPVWLNLAWQPLTYWTVYPPVPNALMNFTFILIGIYFFLGPYEEMFGVGKMIGLCVAGVLASAIGCIALGFVVPHTMPIAGASPIALASLGAFPIIAGDRKILFMFVVPMSGWAVVGLTLAGSALVAVLSTDPFIFVSSAAALGAGIAYTYVLTRPKSSPPPRKRRTSGPDLRVVRGGADDEPRWLN